MPFLKTLLSILFPIRCIGCGAYDTWLCAKCHQKIPRVTQQQCPVCRDVPTAHGEWCTLCAESAPPLDGILVAARYRGTLLKKAVHYYKYRFATDLATPLGALLREAILRHPSLPAPDCIIPVPLHAKRLRWRGFNQAHLLAEALHPHIPIDTTSLIRHRYTTPQMSLTHRAQRMTNLASSFSIEKRAAIRGKTILLIDDIATTGSTLNTCAQTLKDAGAHAVYAIVLARE